ARGARGRALRADGRRDRRTARCQRARGAAARVRTLPCRTDRENRRAPHQRKRPARICLEETGGGSHLMVAHPGHRPRSRQRYPGGKIKPRDEGDLRAPTLWRRIKDGAVKGGAHPYAGTVLGRLSIFGLLADAEVEAGFRVAEIVGRYERVSGAPRRTCASPAYERGFGCSLEGQVLADANLARRFERRVRQARRA